MREPDSGVLHGNTGREKKLSDVSIVKCPDYDRDRATSAIRQAVDLLGGIGEFVKPGDRVLIKPNLLKAMPPQAAVTTHPEVVRAVIRLVHETGGQALVGDSPGMGDLRKVAERCGILDVVREEGALLAEMTEAVEVKNRGRFHRFEVARAAREADSIINLPKLKTHGMTTLTGAVKNLFGCVPGKRKVQWHFKAGVNHELFMMMLVELYALLRPRLTVMDSVIGMDGNGPGSGDPCPVGTVIAGRDAVAVDVIAGQLVGVAAEELPVLMAARSAGVGETRLDRIRVLGGSVADAAIKRFRLPPREHTEWPLPEWARSSLKNAFTTRPLINHALCIKCGICQGHCPQGAIKDSERGLLIRYRECIRCFCCQEFCPQGAITVGKGWGLKIVS
jgi:uncharacterized protein (DUF362 family)/Pyruvate/2-oxoacid:ferredoxin oxidoreductase delta subunit